MYAAISSALPRSLLSASTRAGYDVEVNNISSGLESHARERFTDRRVALQSYLVNCYALNAADVHVLTNGSSFILECVAVRESLFLPVRSSSKPILSTDPAFEYSRHQYDPRHDATEECTAQHHSPPPTRGIFKRLIKSMKSLSFSSAESNAFRLSGDDAMLLLLQTALNHTNTDLNVLSEDSRLADEAESRRLIGKLTKAGLF